jgi:hypothetical protein
MTVDEYLAQLEDRLGRLPGGLLPAAPSAVVFVFREPSGPRRVTVELSPKGAAVRAGAQVDAGHPTAYVFATVSDWVAYFEHADRARLARIDLYGEVALLKALAGPAQGSLWASRQTQSEEKLGWSIQ